MIPAMNRNPSHPRWFPALRSLLLASPLLLGACVTTPPEPRPGVDQGQVGGGFGSEPYIDADGYEGAYDDYDDGYYEDGYDDGYAQGRVYGGSAYGAYPYPYGYYPGYGYPGHYRSPYYGSYFYGPGYYYGPSGTIIYRYYDDNHHHSGGGRRDGDWSRAYRRNQRNEAERSVERGSERDGRWSSPQGAPARPAPQPARPVPGAVRPGPQGGGNPAGPRLSRPAPAAQNAPAPSPQVPAPSSGSPLNGKTSGNDRGPRWQDRVRRD